MIWSIMLNATEKKINIRIKQIIWIVVLSESIFKDSDKVEAWLGDLK